MKEAYVLGWVFNSNENKLPNIIKVYEEEQMATEMRIILEDVGDPCKLYFVIPSYYVTREEK